MYELLAIVAVLSSGFISASAFVYVMTFLLPDLRKHSANRANGLLGALAGAVTGGAVFSITFPAVAGAAGAYEVALLGSTILGGFCDTWNVWGRKVWAFDEYRKGGAQSTGLLVDRSAIVFGTVIEPISSLLQTRQTPAQPLVDVSFDRLDRQAETPHHDGT